MKRRERARVANVGTQVTRPSGSVLATRGSVARQVVIILEGVATAFHDGAPERLCAGAQFGALEVLTRAPHADTILADSSVLLWVLTVREFRTMLRDIPWLAEWYASASAVAAEACPESPVVSAPARRFAGVR